MWKRFVAVAANVLIIWSPLFAQSWLELRPGGMSEADVLRRYGEPENVVIRFIGFHAYEAWRKQGVIPTYDFEYFLPTRASRVHDGPLGEAHEVSVKFSEDKKIWQVIWKYRFGLRLHKKTGEQPTPITAGQIEQSLGGSPLIKKMGPEIPDGGIYRQRKDGLVVDVEYLGAGNDITVSVRH